MALVIAAVPIMFLITLNQVGALIVLDGPDYLSAFTPDQLNALAYTGIAFVWAGRYQLRLAPGDEAVPLANTIAERALELDSTLAEAYHALAVKWILSNRL